MALELMASTWNYHSYSYDPGHWDMPSGWILERDRICLPHTLPSCKLQRVNTTYIGLLNAHR